MVFVLSVALEVGGRCQCAGQQESRVNGGELAPQTGQRAWRFFRESVQGTGPDATGYKGFYYHFLDMTGDVPIVLCRIGEFAELPIVRQLLQGHAYWMPQQSLLYANPGLRPSSDVLARSEGGPSVLWPYDISDCERRAWSRHLES